MKLLYKILFIFLTVLLLSPVIRAQDAILKGKVTDVKTSDPLPFVNIGLKDHSTGTFSDSNGMYHLDLPKGKYIIFFSYVGYDRLEKEVTIDGRQPVILNVELTLSSQELNTVVVSGSKYAQKIQESISSIEVLKAKTVEISNIP